MKRAPRLSLQQSGCFLPPRETIEQGGLFMQYRKLGNTEISVGEISMGSEGFVNKSQKDACALVATALENGINYFDMYNSDPQLHRNLGLGLGSERKNVFIQGHLCTAWENEQYLRTRDFELTKKSFENMMRNIGTDYIDVGMLHCIDGEEDFRKVFEGPIYRYAQELKKAGVIKHIGISSHNPVTAKKAVELGDIEVVMFSLNPCYDMVPPSENLEDLWADESYENPLHNFDPVREDLYMTCAARGVGITVMKAFGGGDLLDEKLSPFGVKLSPAQCLHYALTRPAVATVLGGFHTPEEICASVQYFETSEEERDYAPVLSHLNKHSFSGRCMYCGHCAPCPVRIDVASINKYLNLAIAQGFVPETVAMHYSLLEHHAGECLSCGSCDRNCPFGVPAMRQIALAKETFGY